MRGKSEGKDGKGRRTATVPKVFGLLQPKGGSGGAKGGVKGVRQEGGASNFDVSQRVWIGGLTEEVALKDLHALCNMVGECKWVEIHGKTACACYSTDEEARTAISKLNGSSTGEIILEFDSWTNASIKHPKRGPDADVWEPGGWEKGASARPGHDRGDAGGRPGGPGPRGKGRNGPDFEHWQEPMSGWSSGGWSGGEAKRPRRDDGGKGSWQKDHPEKDALVVRVKHFQRLGDQQQQAWWDFCEHSTDNMRDPGRVSCALLREFVDAHDVPEQPRRGRPPIQTGPEHEAFVTRIKAYQRGGEWQKQNWWDFCEEFTDDVRDPARIESEFLQRFIDSYEVGEADHGPRKPWIPKIVRGDPEHEDLVRRIKEYQRASQLQKESWWTFADENTEGIRDPARVDKEMLQFFCEEFGVY